MQRVALSTAEQEHVVNGVIPPFLTLPQVITWGVRTFALRKAPEKPGDKALYSEVFAVALVETDPI